MTGLLATFLILDSQCVSLYSLKSLFCLFMTVEMGGNFFQVSARCVLVLGFW